LRGIRDLQRHNRFLLGMHQLRIGALVL
jgi:hypothetical protein